MRTGLRNYYEKGRFQSGRRVVVNPVTGSKLETVKIRLIDKPLSVPMKGMPKHGFAGDGHLSGLDVTIQFVQPTRDS